MASTLLIAFVDNCVDQGFIYKSSFELSLKLILKSMKFFVATYYVAGL